MEVLIRFNQNFRTGQSPYEWRAVIDGKEHLCNHIDIKVQCETVSKELPEHGLKYHIKCECANAHFTYPQSSLNNNGLDTLKVLTLS